MAEETKEIKVIEFVFLPDTIDPKKEYLQGVAAEIAKIEADPDKMDKDTLDLVNSTKNNLVKARTSIEKACKAARDPHTAFNKEVSKYEKELIEILEPQETRLKGIEKDAKKVAITEERRKTLPEFKEKLASIGDGIGNFEEERNVLAYDEELLKLDPPQRDVYYNERLGTHLENKRIQAQEKETADAEIKAAEQKKIDDDKAEIERQKEKLATEKTNTRIQRLLTLGFKDSGNVYRFEECAIEKIKIEALDDDTFNNFINDSTEYIDGVKETQAAAAKAEEDLKIKAAEEAATEEAEKKAKQAKDDAEEKRQADEKAAKEAEEAKAEEKSAQEKERTKAAKYEAFLVENGRTEENAKEFYSTYDNATNVTILYRKVATYKHTI